MGKTRFPRLSRAANDTNWLAWQRQVSVGIISAVLAFLFLPRFGISKDFMEQLVLIFCLVIAAVILVPIGEFICNFFKAGKLIMQDEIGTLKSQLEDRDLRITALTSDLNQIKKESKIHDLLFITKWKQKINTASGQGIKALVAQLDITNKSQEEFYATPRLRFSDTSGTVFQIEGLWSDRPLPRAKSTIKEPMTFLAGERHKLDLALQFEGEAVWYGIDNASPFANYRYEKYKLTGPIHITITLEGNMAPITRYFQLKEENGVPKFDEI